MYGNSPKAQASSAVHSMCALFMFGGRRQRGREPLSLWQTSCGMRTFGGSELQWARLATGCFRLWLLGWGQGSKTSLFSYCSYNLWIQVFQKYPDFHLETSQILKWKCIHTEKHWLLGGESSCLWPKAYSEGPSVSFIAWFAASYTGSCVFNKKHFCISKRGYTLIALNIPKER